MMRILRKLIALNDQEVDDVGWARLTKTSLAARVSRVANICFAPLSVIVFILERPLSYFVTSLNDPPTLTFLRDQYDYLITGGVAPASAAVPLRLWECMIWIFAPILLLRLVLSPFLFGVVNWRKRFQTKGGSIVRASLGWLLMGGAPWAAIDIRSSASVPAYGSLLNRAPQAFVCLEAVVFFAGIALFVEGLIMLVDFAATSVRKRFARTSA